MLFQPTNCKRCGEDYQQIFGNQVYCSRCRAVIVAAEDASVSRFRKSEHPKAWLPGDVRLREFWDVRIIDEYGRECWAKDLAQRYRKELNARLSKDYRERTS